MAKTLCGQSASSCCALACRVVVWSRRSDVDCYKVNLTMCLTSHRIGTHSFRSTCLSRCWRQRKSGPGRRHSVFIRISMGNGSGRNTSTASAKRQQYVRTAAQPTAFSQSPRSTASIDAGRGHIGPHAANRSSCVRVYRMEVCVCANGLIVPRELGEDSVCVQKQGHTEHKHVYNTHRQTPHRHGTGHVLQRKREESATDTCPCTLASLSMGSTLTSSPPSLHDTAPNLHA